MFPGKRFNRDYLRSFPLDFYSSKLRELGKGQRTHCYNQLARRKKFSHDLLRPRTMYLRSHRLAEKYSEKRAGE